MSHTSYHQKHVPHLTCLLYCLYLISSHEVPSQDSHLQTPVHHMASIIHQMPSSSYHTYSGLYNPYWYSHHEQIPMYSPYSYFWVNEGDSMFRAKASLLQGTGLVCQFGVSGMARQQVSSEETLR